MTGASNYDGEAISSSPSPHARSARPAQLSVADFAQSQRVRSRHSGLSFTHSGGPGEDDPEPRRSVSGSSRTAMSGGFSSLRKKMSKSMRSSGFLLDNVSGLDNRRSRPTSSLSNTHSAPAPANGHKAMNDPDAFVLGATQRSSVADMDGASESRQSRDGRTTTPQSKRNTRVSLRASPASSAVDSPPSYASSRISTEHGMARPSSDRSRPVSAAIDPSQLVRMALNLSESRRMQLDPGHLPSIPVASESRQVSTAYSSSGSGIEASRDRLPGDRRSLPRPATGSQSVASSSRHGEFLTQGSSPLSSSKNSTVSPGDVQPEYIFSPATLERAQRARKYIELSAEYRRLLQFLPPLRPCTQSNGEQSQRELGRAYNPLQYIRNRRSRREHNSELDSAADGWDDASHVQYWVSSVENESRQPGFLAEDVALLPQWSSGISHSTNPESEETKSRQTDANHGRKESHSKRFDWSFAPADMLQDAYWLEQDHHKTLICTKQGNKIFHSFARPLNAIHGRRGRSGTTESTQSRSSVSSEEALSPFSGRSHRRVNSALSEESDAGWSKKNHHHNPLHGTGRVRNALFRRRAKSDDVSDDGTDAESIGQKRRRSPSHRPRANIGPLEKHMQAMIAQESRNERVLPTSPKTVSSGPNSPEGSRRHGISEGSALQSSNDDDHAGEQRDVFGGPLEGPTSAPPTSVPRISVEVYDDDDRALPQYRGNGQAKQPSLSQESFSRASDSADKKKRSTRLGFWSRDKNKRDNRIEAMDFAHVEDQGADTPQYGSEWESGMESIGRMPTTASTIDGRGSIESDLDAADSSTAGKATISPGSKGKLLKGGRIGELVRNESSAASNIVFKRQPPRQQSPEKPKSPVKATSDSDESRSRLARPMPKAATSARQRSSSAAAEPARGTSPQFHIKNLPTFQTQASRDRSNSQSRSPGRDHITRQGEERRIQRLNSRLSSIAPSSIDTGDISRSSRELSRINTQEDGGPVDRQQSYGFGQYTGSAAAVRAADKRLSAVMNTDEGGGQDTSPASPLFTTTRMRPHRTASTSQGWSIEKVRIPKKKVQEKTVAISSRDVAQVQSLLISAGVKAQTISRRADEPRDEVTSFLSEAFRGAGQDSSKLGRMSTRQAHVLAAQLISDRLAQTLQAFDNSVVKFRSQTCQRLTEQVDDLRDRATSDLMPKVQSAGGEADAFVARLMTTHTLAVRQVMDSVEKMLRKRRRRLRYVQRQLFTLLEWVLVALMWWIWLIVFILGIFRSIFTGSFRLVKWLLWL